MTVPKSLVIVESPAKAKTINKYLGKQYLVMASLGHVKDLPKKDLAVDVENGFEPKYEVIEGKKKLIHELKQASKKVESVYLAADPDREGEAICFHLQEELDGKKKGSPQIYRVMFNEITANAIRKTPIKPWRYAKPAPPVNVHTEKPDMKEAMPATHHSTRLPPFRKSDPTRMKRMK